MNPREGNRVESRGCDRDEAACIITPVLFVAGDASAGR